MNIGDRVRLLHYKEEGVITRFLEGKLVEVSIAGDFRIPVLRSELVVISTEEKRIFGDVMPEESITTAQAGGLLASRGIFMALEAFNDRMLTIYLINNTDYDIPLSFGGEYPQGYRGIFTGIIKSKTYVGSEQLNVQDFDKWPTFVFQILYHREGYHTLQAPLLKKVKYKAASFFKTKHKAPLLGKEAYLFQVDRDEVQNINPAKLAESMVGDLAKPTQPNLPLARPAKEIDLHIEQLTKDHARMSNREMLELQIQTFEKALDAAIATGMSEIIFIHGVGSGNLRNELHKRLSRHTHIKFFEDARKEKFGYGATLVRIK